MAKNFVTYRLLIDEYLMRSITFDYSNDYPSTSHWLHAHTISSNFFLNLFPVIKINTLMVLVDNINSQISIELSARKPMYKGHDENRAANQIYLLDSNWNVKNEIFRKSSYLSYSLVY